MSDRMEWTPELREQLDVMLDQGHNMAEIARRMGLERWRVAGYAKRRDLRLAERKVRTPLPPIPSFKNCRWPHGHPGEPEFGYCGAPVPRSGLPYCAVHMAMAYRPAELR